MAGFSSRSIKRLDDSFSSGSIMASPSWIFRPGSRADQIHHGRPGIKRRHHSAYLEDIDYSRSLEHLRPQAGSTGTWKETSSRRTQIAPGNQLQDFKRNDERFDNHIGGVVRREFTETQTTLNPRHGRQVSRSSSNFETTSARVPVQIEEESDWDRSDRNFVGQRNEQLFTDEANYNQGRPQSFSREFVGSPTAYDTVGYRENQINDQRASRNGTQGRGPQKQTQEHPEPSGFVAPVQYNGEWQPVRVIRGSEEAINGNRNPGSRPPQSEYSSYSYDRRTTPIYEHGIRTKGSGDGGGRYGASESSDWTRSQDRNTRHVMESSRSTDEPRQTQRSWQYSQNQSREIPSSTQIRNQETRGIPLKWNGYLNEASGSWEDGRGGSQTKARYPAEKATNYSYTEESVFNSGNGRAEGRPFESRNNNNRETAATYTRESANRSGTLQNGARMGSEQFGSRSRSREVPSVYDGDYDSNFINGRSKSSGRSEGQRYRVGSTENDEKDFLNKLQKELENQRLNWKPEIDRLNRSTLLPDDTALENRMSSMTLEAGKNNYVDTSSGTPIFKAYVDISEFPPTSVKINFDRYTNKVVVEASQTDALGTVGKTFTQKIALPRYADDTSLVARINNNGVLRIEVPLLYYFPEKSVTEKKPRAFVYEARNSSVDGSKMVEIVVNPGSEITARDLRAEVADGSLFVWARANTREETLVQKYVLPPTADVQGIKNRIGNDGCLTILIPVV